MPYEVAQAAAPALGNFYFGPVGLRTVFEPAYMSETSRLKSRSKYNSKLDMPLDVNPRPIRVPVEPQSLDILDIDGDVNDHGLIQDQSMVHEDENEGETEPATSAPDEKSDKQKSKKKKKKPKKKNKHKHKKKKKKKHSKLNPTLGELCPKLRLSILLAIIGLIIIVACICALFLRSRIVKLLKKIWPRRKKKQSNKDLLSAEEGDNPYQLSPGSKKSGRKSKGKTMDTATQHSRASTAKPEDDDGRTGCSPCSKKKKKSSKKRRK